MSAQRKWRVLDEDGVVHDISMDSWCDANDAAQEAAEERNSDSEYERRQFFRVRDDHDVETTHVVELDWSPVYTAVAIGDETASSLPAWPEDDGDNEEGEEDT